MITSSGNQRTATVRWTNNLLPLAGLLLITGGIALLTWVTYLWLTPGQPPYQYQLIAEGKASEFPELELEAWPAITINKYEVRTTETDKPIAHAYFGQRESGTPVLLNWENHTGEPLITLDRKPAELSALAAAINKHTPQDALILAWWDTSRQIQLLSERTTLFNGHLNAPLIIPAHWQEHAQAIQVYEDRIPHTTPSEQERDQFQRFTEALILSPEAGVAKLRELIGTEQEAYLIIHVSDLYKLGLMHSDRFGVAYKNYLMTGNIHGLINHMKVEMNEHGYNTYTLQSLTDQDVRAFFLTDEHSPDTLIAHMLPFTGKPPPLDFKAAQLVYQQGGYWVYKLP